MSDPVKNEEIEDVLSSIRRLVSESGGVPEEAEDEVAKPPSGSLSFQDTGLGTDARNSELSERLVLTPALRVADEDDAPDNGDQDTRESDSAELTEDLSDEAPAEAQQEGDSAPTHDDEGAQGHSAHQPAEPETGESVAADTDEVGGSKGDEEHVALHAVDEPAAETDAEGSEADAELPEAEQAGETLKERIQQLETAVLQTENDWEDDMDTGGDNAPRPMETLQWEDHTDEDGTGGTADSESHGAPKDAGEGRSDGASEDDLAGEFDFVDDDEAVLDEDALRDMVADIVRRELQGALGERITRNVRKLVRREIHRALMAQELD